MMSTLSELRVVIEQTGDELFDKIQAKVLETQERLEQFGLGYFFITIKLTEFKNGDAGVAVLGSAIIHINPAYFAKHEREMLDVTVPHELIHHYLYEYHGVSTDTHGKQFMDLCRAIGVDASEFHDMTL